MAIDDAIKAVRDRIKKAALRAGRNPEEIKLIAVTKTVSLEKIAEAVRAGVVIFGENRVQEAHEKISNFKFQISNLKIEWHLIGHLQSNKTKNAVQLFDLIHSIDSAGLAEEVNRQAEKINKVQRALVEVKLSEEETKHGVSENNLMPLLEKTNNLQNLKLEGLMTMPPFFDDPERARPYFRRLRKLRDDINKIQDSRFKIQDLSMGMSNDFEVAIEEGATMVRIGTAIFGERE
ncbi:MAG: YggS family pyridoxal phosphate-dependent enzyme [Nitrospirae bacterium]|nr:YggS family pyridoxal phosphate-dependent enzyme [Nitrospirota bacterium]